MSLLKKNILSSYSSMRISLFSYFFNDARLIYAKYHSCLNNPIKIQSKILKQRKLIEFNYSVLQTIKEKNYNLAVKIKKMLSNVKFFIPGFGFKYKYRGYLWYKSLDELNIQDFFINFNMADTFYSRFKIIELHVWMLLYHLPKTNKKNTFVRLGLIEAMWEDNEKRAQLINEFNMNYKKNFRALNQKFLLSLLLYDDGFYKSDAALSSAVWYNFFDKKDTDPLLIEALVSYIRFQMHSLNSMNVELLNNKEEKTGIWLSAKPHFEELKSKY